MNGTTRQQFQNIFGLIGRSIIWFSFAAAHILTFVPAFRAQQSTFAASGKGCR